MLLARFSAQAGLRFQPAGAPGGADAAALTADGATLWLATARGVYRYEAGLWTVDGLSDQAVSSVAVADGSVWAATGDRLYRRSAAGVYLPENLPGANPFPSVLLSDGSNLYAGGLGVYRRSGGSWSALPATPPGLVSSMVFLGPDLVAGLNTGGAVVLSGSGWTSLQTGFGTQEATNALVVVGSVLYAGSSRALYSWSGTSWTVDATFGLHDVRALSAAQGILRAATNDAGLLKRSGTSWAGDSSGLLTLSARAFAGSGSDLYVATGGGPVYQLTGSGWVELGTSSLQAATVSDVLSGSRMNPGSGDLLVATRGAGVGLTPAAGSTASAQQVPAGCGDVTALAVLPSGPGDVLAATGCGPLAGPSSWTPVPLGLPQGAILTALASTANGVYGGTAGSGVFRFDGSTWNADTAGLDPNASVLALRLLGSTLYAATGQGLYARVGSGPFADVGDGLPGLPPISLGGSDPTFAGFVASGVYRRDGVSTWRRDAYGIGGSSVFSLEVAGGRLVAAAGTSGVLMKREGGFCPENQGLPTGADARLVRAIANDAAGATIRRGVAVGTAGSGLYVASTAAAVRTIPVVLDVVGGAGARFRTELTLGNPGSQPATLNLTFNPAPLFGAPQIPASTVTQTVAAGAEIRVADALDFLRALGLAIPPATATSPIAGSLSLSADLVGKPGAATDDVYAVARTYARDASGGSYGLFYDAVSDVDAAEGEATVYGLRGVAGLARSNLAVVHVPGRATDSISVEVQVFSATGTASGPPLTRTLAPGEWYQWNGILGQAGLPDGSYGYARVRRVAGSGPFVAYGIVNDAATSDGSYLPAFRPGGLAAARRLVVPVVLDVFGAAGSHFTTELTIANDGPIATPVDLTYRPALGSAAGVPNVTVQLASRAQMTIPDILQYLRDHGVQIPAGSTGPQAGTLAVDFRYLTSLDSPRTIALARTTTPNPNTAVGGTFGLFYPAVALGGGARTSALVPGLAQDSSVRSNLAVAHVGGGSELPITLSVQLYDADHGVPAGNPLVVTLQPREWTQWSNVLAAAGVPASVTHAFAVVTRTTGDDTFVAYGVLNDAITSDGSYLKMIPKETY